MRWFVVLLLLVFVGECLGAITVEKYQKAPNDGRFKIYIAGVGEGVSFVNVRLKMRGQPPLYCEPEDSALGPDDYLRILNSELKQPDIASLGPDMTVEVLMIRGLERTFPCP